LLDAAVVVAMAAAQKESLAEAPAGRECYWVQALARIVSRCL
jgi:hypothetical protein